MQELVYFVFPALTLAVAASLYRRARKAREASSVAIWSETQTTGLTEPASLHPVLDPSVCVGAGSCVIDCPEQAMGIIDGKGILINPSVCIGHGACAAACPVGAIRLVFGTARRGMEIPAVDPHFETNVRGIFIAGELGGMGLIRKAVDQGKQAMQTIAKRRDARADFDVIIVGAGPAGIAATLAAKQAGLRYLTIEQETTLGGTALHYPRRKIVMTAPMDLPLVGKVAMREISKESLIELWHDVMAKTGIEISFATRLEKLESASGLIRVHTDKGIFATANVLLAIGRRGTPRRLGAAGEELAKVLYRLIEPEQFRGANALVVGGGDSALEAALALADEPGTQVTLVYRGETFGRVKPPNRERMEAACSAGRIDVRMKTEVLHIAADHVTLMREGQQTDIPNEVLIVCAGGILPMSLLKDAGIRVETRHGED